VLLHELTAVVVEDLVTAYHRAHDTRVNAAREAELQDKKGGGGERVEGGRRTQRMRVVGERRKRIIFILWFKVFFFSFL
jgi:hypothetical protein